MTITESPLSPNHKSEGKLSRLVAQNLETRIVNREFEVGCRLPSERELADIYNVSRVTIRDAVRTLEQRGFVHKKPGSGNYVSEMDQLALGEAIERYFKFTLCSPEDLLDLRELIEPEIAARSAVRAADDDLKVLRDCAQEIESAFEVLESTNDVELPVEADIRFHETLARTCGNHLLHAIFTGLHLLMRSSLISQNRTIYSKEAAYSHRLIYHAIRDRNPDQARKAMHLHLHFARVALGSTPDDAAN